MGKIIAGIVIALLVLILGGLAIAMLGLVPTNADVDPPRWEQRFAMGAVDAAIERKAPRVSNPLPPSDENLIAGMKIYTMNCAGCHGGLDNKPSVLFHSMYPPPPQLILDPMDDPEWQIYYAIRKGIRYSGMPAWNKALSEQDMWKVTAFLSRLEKLSPAVQDYWKKSFGAAPPSGSPEGANHHHSDD